MRPEGNWSKYIKPCNFHVDVIQTETFMFVLLNKDFRNTFIAK